MKKHFIFLDKAGIIYYCWMFIILFIGQIFGYEGTETINWPAIIFITAFFIILIYTWFSAYYTIDTLKFPYRSKIKINTQPKEIWHWKFLSIKKIQYSNLQHSYLLTFNKAKKEEPHK